MIKLARIAWLVFLGINPFASAAQSVHGLPNSIETTISDYQQGKISQSEAILSVRESLLHNHERIKCGNPIIHALGINGEALHKTNSDSAPQIASTYISPSGKFKFDYYTTGSDSVWTYDHNSNGIPDYVERAGAEMDAIWQSQVVELGFRDPLASINPYPISFESLDYYGHTEYNGKKIVINSTFVGLDDNTDPEDHYIGALKVTLAHEFKHAVQYMYNKFSGDSHQWAEMDATLMEEVNYDEVNDYYNYIVSSGSLFTNPETTVIPGSYEDITFALFFHEKYGAQFWPNVWDRTVNGTPVFLDAVDEELQSMGSNLTEAYAEMALWHTYSGRFAVEGFGFDEAAFYPTIRRRTTLRANMTQYQSNQSVNKFAFHVVAIAPSGNTGYVNLGLSTTIGDEALLSIGSKKNPEWKQVQKNATESTSFKLIKNNESWTNSDTVFVVVSNSSRTNSLTYRILNSTDLNPGLFLWGDIDDSDFLNSMDVRKLMQNYLSNANYSDFELLMSDNSQNGTVSGLDMAKFLEVINQKQSFLEIDANSDKMWPEVSQFRIADITKLQTETDSLILKIIPLDGADQADTKLKLEVDYSNQPYLYSLAAQIPIDTAQFSIVSFLKDDFLSGAELDWQYQNGAIEFILVNDEPIPSGAIIEVDLNRKESISEYTFQLTEPIADEIQELRVNSVNISVELPTRLGVYTEKLPDSFQELPEKFIVFPAYPNPFNPTTTLKYELAEPTNVHIDLYSILGQRVMQVESGIKSAGVHTSFIQAHDLPSGVYLIRVNVGEQQQLQKIVLIK